jgi:hypothetical protein
MLVEIFRKKVRGIFRTGNVFQFDFAFFDTFAYVVVHDIDVLSSPFLGRV